MVNNNQSVSSADSAAVALPASAPRKPVYPDWDDEASPTGGAATLLPPGVYPFRITDMKKDFYEQRPGGKVPSCHRAILTFRIDGGDAGEVTVRENFFVLDTFAWKVSNLLQSVGLITPGGRFQWRQLTEVEGLSGRCEIDTQEYKGRDGKLHRKNAITRFLEKPTCAPRKAFQKGVF